MINLSIVIRSLIALITIWITHKYLNIFFEKQPLPVAFRWSCWIAYYFEQAYVENHQITSLRTLFFNMFCLFLVSLMLYKGSFLNKIIKVIALWVLWMLAECFTVGIFINQPIPYEQTVITGSLFSKLLVVIALQIVERHAHHSTRRMPLLYWFLLLLIPASTVYIAYTLFQLIYQTAGDSLSYTPAFLFLLLINVITFEVYERITQSLEAEAENAIFEQQLESFTMQMEAQKSSDENFRREKHDFVNQIVVIKSYLENNKISDALSLLSDLLKSYSKNSTSVSQSGNNVVDAIINYKYAIASNKGIPFQIRLFLPETLSIAPRDLCIILGNTIDNAIEASESIPTPQIELSMEIRRSFLVLVIKNSFQGTLHYDKQGNLLTTKHEKNLHGYGFSSVKRVVEKYHGEILIETPVIPDTGEKFFCLTIYLEL